MDCDAVVIGAGQAGPPLAARLGHAGHRVAVIERQRMGGTCVNVGYIPTKTLVGSARVAYYAHEAAALASTWARSRSIWRRSRPGKTMWLVPLSRVLTAWLERMEGVDVTRGHAGSSIGTRSMGGRL